MLLVVAPYYELQNKVEQLESQVENLQGRLYIAITLFIVASLTAVAIWFWNIGNRKKGK